LVVTSPPYGASTHGHGRVPGYGRGQMGKVNNRYSTNRDNLAHRRHDELADGFTHILTGCAAILRPGGVVAVTARPYRHKGDLIDIPSMAVAAGLGAGLRLHEELPALIARICSGRLVAHASVFQRHNVHAANLTDDPQWLPQHEEIILFRQVLQSVDSSRLADPQREPEVGSDDARAAPVTSRSYDGASDQLPKERP
jgi:hypothetical protein